MINFVKVGVASLVLGIASMSAVSAATVQTFCPANDTSNSTREFTVTVEAPGASCLMYGSGNINGNTTANNVNGRDPFLIANPTYSYLGAPNEIFGNVVLTLTGMGGLAGKFTIAVANGFELTNAAIGFKSGGNDTPTFAVFGLANGTLTGDWTIEDRQQGLSHAIVYGTIVPATVPVPAAGFLLVGALGGLAALRRRRKLA